MDFSFSWRIQWAVWVLVKYNVWKVENQSKSKMLLMKVKRRHFESNGKPTEKYRNTHTDQKVGWNAIKQEKPQRKYTITKAKKERKKKTATKKKHY